MMFPKVLYKKRKPKLSTRNEFSAKVRQEIIDRDGERCKQCGGMGNHIHHVVPRARQGRGVKENGLVLCHRCHDLIHSDAELMNEWIKHYKSFYGDKFWQDKWDKE